MNEILFVIVILVAKITIIQAGDKEELEKLEKEKKEVVSQINEAIEKSIKSLQNNNDSNALLGISFMKDLRNQIRVENNTGDLELDSEDKTQEVRRSLHESRGHKINLDIVDVANIFTKRPSKTKGTREESRLLMQKKVDEWIKQRELERERIQEYRLKMEELHNKLRYEKCPRFGKGSRKKKKLFRKSAQGNGRPRYPCCRKCCKKSILGCL